MKYYLEEVRLLQDLRKINSSETLFLEKKIDIFSINSYYIDTTS